MTLKCRLWLSRYQWMNVTPQMNVTHVAGNVLRIVIWPWDVDNLFICIESDMLISISDRMLLKVSYNRL